MEKKMYNFLVSVIKDFVYHLPDGIADVLSSLFRLQRYLDDQVFNDLSI